VVDDDVGHRLDAVVVERTQALPQLTLRPILAVQVVQVPAITTKLFRRQPRFARRQVPPPPPRLVSKAVQKEVQRACNRSCSV